MNFAGIIIEESLTDKTVLEMVNIVSTEVEPVTAGHKTPWVNQWTMHKVMIPAERAEAVANQLLDALDKQHDWYADFKNDQIHYIVYQDKVFKIDRSKPEQYEAATRHGIARGIPAYQVDFSPHVEEWQRHAR